jgi:hypothetical protein
MPANRDTEFWKNGTMLGYISKLQKRKASFFINIDKRVVNGVNLSKGEELHCYFFEHDRRPVFMVFLDGHERKWSTEEKSAGDKNAWR